MNGTKNQTKNILHAKETFNKIKRQSTEWDIKLSNKWTNRKIICIKKGWKKKRKDGLGEGRRETGREK